MGIDARPAVAGLAPVGAGPARHPALVAGVVLLVALAAIVGLIAGSRLAAGPRYPTDASVDAGFARDMGTHHAQAVQMSALVRDRTDDPAVRQLALDIELTQQHQHGQMYAWLEQWGLRQSSSQPVMAWMADHTDHATTAQAGMPGMATPAELARLADAEGRDAERLFLQLMIPHHEAGVDMAEYAANRAEEDVVRRLAVTVVNAQTAELTVLRDLLQERGGPLE
ncbi:DUF305 domain-containing protein [Georgenia yuyongxinii]|uniref:DUF305 domain-containing protein n=1 Tax=Georgenia yuyongxinii TaxID=2589797 RepID=A0A552WXQ8_9MICO|nr:DUF305 domain-containing protein [Georgenia yuyongxinii]TRW47379.1 DUF305 domain-containing protein [Georgenia yuyongxinii]